MNDSYINLGQYCISLGFYYNGKFTLERKVDEVCNYRLRNLLLQCHLW